MARAEYIAGTEQLRGRGLFSRVVGFLGECLLGIGAKSSDQDAWWKDDSADNAIPDEPAPIRRTREQEHQTFLFDADGSVSQDAAPRHATTAMAIPSTFGPAAPAAPVATAVPQQGATGIGRVQLLPRTEISVRSKNRRTARVVATTRAIPRAEAVATAAAVPVAKGDLIRSLGRSNSLSRGQEGVRWLSVPQRTLLPRYRLFVGTDGVEQDRRTGVMTVVTREQQNARGRVWFG